MALLSLRLLPGRIKKGGFIPIWIALAHNGKTRYVQSPVSLQDEAQFRDGIVVGRPDAKFLNLTLQAELAKYQRALLSVESPGAFSCNELMVLIKNEGKRFNSTLGQLYEAFKECTYLKDASRRVTDCAINEVIKHFGAGYRIEKLSYPSLCEFEKKLREKGNGNSTICVKMSALRKLFSFAQRAKVIDVPVSPFSYYRIPEPDVRDSWLSVEDMRYLRDCNLKGVAVNRIRDLIMLSYYLGGINIADMVLLDFERILRNNRVKYERIKTKDVKKINKYIEFDLPPEARELILKLTAGGRPFATPYQKRSRYHEYFAQSIGQLREQTGLSNLYYYSARKSFSQHAFAMGEHTAVIDYILGHKIVARGSSIYKYIFVTPEMASATMRKVIDKLNADKAASAVSGWGGYEATGAQYIVSGWS